MLYKYTHVPLWRFICNRGGSLGSENMGKGGHIWESHTTIMSIMLDLQIYNSHGRMYWTPGILI